MGILAEKPGMLTTVQDAGRFGYQQYGVSPAGPMDALSFQLANLLVGNPREEGALEMTCVGPTLLFDEDNTVACVGANLSPELNGAPFPMNQAVSIKKGDRLSFGMMSGGGCRAYLAFAGGLSIPLVMGSKSTLIRNHMGGVEGRKLIAGDRISFSAPKAVLPHMERRSFPAQRFPEKEAVLRVVTGPQDTSFSREELRKFFWYDAEITNEFDRMGCRLKRDEPLSQLGDGNIITDGISMGAIQVPPSGQPIIMLADRQSTGGYTKLGTIITVDLPVLAQCMPGMRVRFIRVDLELAQTLYIKRKKQLDVFEQALHAE